MKFKKVFASVLAAACVLGSGAVPSVMAADDTAKEDTKSVTFTVPAGVASKQGDVVEIPIVLDGADASQISGFQMKFELPAELSVQELEVHSKPAGALVEFNADTLEFAVASKDGKGLAYVKSNIIATLKAKVSQDAKNGKSDIKISDVCVMDSDGKFADANGTDKEAVIGSIAIGEEYFKLGDVNFDGLVDASDASDILSEYAALSTNKPSTFIMPNQKKAGDVNFDDNVDASDASLVLAYYSFMSTGGSGDMESWLKTNA